jgi:putative transposase
MVRYQSRRPPQEPLRSRLKESATARVRYGYKRLHVLLRREGWAINHKRVYRLYSEERLTLRRKKPRRRKSAVVREARDGVSRPDQRWAMDFVHDMLAGGRTIRILTVIDVHTRECVALEPRLGFRGEDVAGILIRAAEGRKLPATICVDNGTEFTSKALDHWRTGTR